MASRIYADQSKGKPMIDLQIEKPVTIARAMKLPQLSRNGKPPHVAQGYRWCGKGLKGIVLESVVIGGSRCTTSEAVDRWIAALSGYAVTETTRTPVRRQRDHDRAERTLAAAGW
jgi:hypothetical protein